MSQNSKSGIDLITQERYEQVTKHHRTIAADKENNDEGQLVDAATTIALDVPPGLEGAYIQAHGNHPPIGWDRDIWISMLKKPYKERLVIAGALIAAEIDRISE